MTWTSWFFCMEQPNEWQNVWNKRHQLHHDTPPRPRGVAYNGVKHTTPPVESTDEQIRSLQQKSFATNGFDS